jgi:3'-phosphoadenosine 5'-phosphosulfate (PAPS) 3'-phosphatase
MVEAARAGGAVALEHYRRGFSVTLKADRSPVTEADREAERAIVRRAAPALPRSRLPR